MQPRFSHPEESSLRLDGLSWAEGSLVWPHPAPPLLAERAEMVRSIVPDWAIVAAHTAGWVYTGMGRAEPWALYAPSQPAISPLQRQQWKPRSGTLSPDEKASVRGLTLTHLGRTISDLLTWPGNDESAACQLYTLATPESLGNALNMVTLTAVSRSRARTRRALVEQWWRDYPLVTR